MKKILKNKKAFSIIEILVWMVIFLFWITAVYSTIDSILSRNLTNKYYIIWVNLAREQLELFRNIRDTNFSKQISFSVKNPWDCLENWKCEKFLVDKFYKISNDFSLSSGFFVKVNEENKPNSLTHNDLKNFQICLFEIDETWKKYNLYDYCDKNLSSTKKELKIYKFLEISKVEWYEDWLDKNEVWKEKALKVTSKIVWYAKRYQNFEVSEIFTDFKI